MFTNDLKLMIREGLTFAECVQAFGVDRDTDPYAKAAHEMYHRDGELEIDDTTVLSGSGDNGEYVLAWVWVYNADAGLPDRDADA